MLPPLILAIIAWGVPLGVDAGIWSVDPRAGWVVLPIFALAVAWLVWIWTHNGLELAIANGWSIPQAGGRSIQFVVPLLAAAGFFFFFDLPPLKIPDCAPKVEWSSRVDIGFNEDLNLPSKTQYLTLTPYGPEPYWMNVRGDFGGLSGLEAKGHRFSDKGERVELESIPWQDRPRGIRTRLKHPVGMVSIELVAEDLSRVQLDDPVFECVDGPR